MAWPRYNCSRLITSQFPVNGVAILVCFRIKCNLPCYTLHCRRTFLMTYNERNFVAADILGAFVHKDFKVLDSKSGHLSRT